MSEAAATEVCLINIGPKQRARRMTVGIVGGLLGMGIGAALIALHAPLVARLGAALPLLVGAYGYFQAREKT